MNYRHEWKHEISYGDLLTLRMRLSAVMQSDSHAIGNKYEIRSLYFDTPSDRALREKIDGVNRREKFRIRFYNRDTSFLSLLPKGDNTIIPACDGFFHRFFSQRSGKAKQ